MTSEADIKEEVTETTSQAEDKIEKPNEGTSDEKGESSEAKKGTVKEDGDKEVKLYVGNLPDNCKRSSLQEQFEKYGKVSQCDIVKNFAFVHMVGEKSAKDAVDNLDDTEFCGTHIQVQYAKSKGKPAEDECFQCGRHGHWAKDCPKRRRYDDYRRDRYDYRGYDYGPPRRGPYDRPPPRGGYYDPYMDRRPAPPGRDYYSYGSYSYRSRSPNMERRSPPRYTGNYEGYPAPRDGYGTRR